MSTHPARRAVLQRVPIESALPSLAALFHKTVDIAVISPGLASGRLMEATQLAALNKR